MRHKSAPAKAAVKKAQPVCTICRDVERHMAWLLDAMQAVTHSGGPPTLAEVRAYRRRFEREFLAHAPRPIPAVGARRREWLNWLWASELERHPELRVAAHAPAGPISGLILYVLAARVGWVLGQLEQAPSEPKGHQHCALVRRILELRAALGGRPQAVVAGLVDLHPKLVALRLSPAEIRAELAASRARACIAWVSWDDLRLAARYRQDTAMIRELYRGRVVSDDVVRVRRTQRELVELVNALHPSRPHFVYPTAARALH
jgi:hypothetical protein